MPLTHIQIIEKWLLYEQFKNRDNALKKHAGKKMTPDIFSLLNAHLLSRALFVAAELNIAELLADKELSLEDLATKTESDPNSLKRLLYFLTLHHIFTRNDAGHYGNTAFSQTMCTDHPQSIKPFLLHDDETRWNSFGHLGYSIKTGKASFDMLYGQNYFAYLKNHPQLSDRFDDAMTVISHQEDQEIAERIPFKGIIADIGGGKGQLLTYIIQKTPTIQGILLELPEVISTLDETTFTKIAGSFFEPIAIKADIFILKRILHNWNDEKALLILKNVSQAMEDDSLLYIIDGILDCAQDQQLLAAIDLALLTIFQGRERTMQELNALIDQADLEIIHIIPINNLICAIECKKRR